MNYTNLFSCMQAEVTLVGVIVLLVLFDLFAGERARRPGPFPGGLRQPRAERVRCTRGKFPGPSPGQF